MSAPILVTPSHVSTTPINATPSYIRINMSLMIITNLILIIITRISNGNQHQTNPHLFNSVS